MKEAGVDGLTVTVWYGLLAPAGTAREIVQALAAATARATRDAELRKRMLEQGVAMLSSVLTSNRAVQVNVEIMRAFVRLRDLIGHNRELAKRVDALEAKYDRQFKVVFDAIRELMSPPMAAPKRRIGFVSTDEGPVRKALKR